MVFYFIFCSSIFEGDFLKIRNEASKGFPEENGVAKSRHRSIRERYGRKAEVATLSRFSLCRAVMQIDERRNVETHVTSPLTDDTASRRCLNSPPVKSGCADVLQDRATQRANVPLNTGPSSGSRVTPIISTIDSRGIRSIETRRRDAMNERVCENNE